ISVEGETGREEHPSRGGKRKAVADQTPPCARPPRVSPEASETAAPAFGGRKKTPASRSRSERATLSVDPRSEGPSSKTLRSMGKCSESPSQEVSLSEAPAHQSGGDELVERDIPRESADGGSKLHRDPDFVGLDVPGAPVGTHQDVE